MNDPVVNFYDIYILFDECRRQILPLSLSTENYCFFNVYNLDSVNVSFFFFFLFSVFLCFGSY